MNWTARDRLVPAQSGSSVVLGLLKMEAAKMIPRT